MEGERTYNLSRDKEHILIIDDEPKLSSLCARILEGHGYKVTAPPFGAEAIDMAENRQYDLLLCDIRMPRINGLQLFHRIHKKNPDLVAVMITGHATVETVIEALNKGVEGFIQKPFTSEELLTAVDQAFQKSRLRRENMRLKALMPLLELNKLLIDDTETDTVFASALQIAKRKLRADSVSLLLQEETNKDVLSVVASHGLNKKYHTPKNVKEDGGILGYVFNSGQPLLLNGAIDGLGIDVHMEDRGITSGLCIPIQSNGRTLGCMCASRFKKVQHFSQADLDLFMIISNQIASHLENLRLYGKLRTNYIKTIKALTGAIEAKDSYTKGHSYQVAVYAARIGRHLGLHRAEIENLRIAGMLHDVGKIGVPEDVLFKPGPLSGDEKAVIMTHPFYGMKILEPIGLPHSILCAIHHHHEKYDGTGYPDGLKGEAIPLNARILQVADALDAMTSDRPYRSMFKWEQVENELTSNSGTQFDPKMITAAIELAKSGRLFPSKHPSRPPADVEEKSSESTTLKTPHKSQLLLGKLNPAR